MPHTLGFDRCKCLTLLEKHHIENSLNNEINRIEKDIEKDIKKEKTTKKGKSLLQTKNQLYRIRNRIQNTPDCQERYGE